MRVIKSTSFSLFTIHEMAPCVNEKSPSPVAQRQKNGIISLNIWQKMDGNGERVDMMKVLVTGADGMLGRDVMRALREKHVNARGVDVADFDVTDGAAVREWVTAEKPDAIIHLAAYTDLLKAETEPAKCIDVNAMGTLNMVRAALAIGAKLMLMSSSEVFGAAPDVIHGTRDKTCAANVYGLSKVQAEEAVRALMTRSFIVRTGCLFSAAPKGEICGILATAQDHQKLTISDDLMACPTYTLDLARAMVSLIQTEKFGIYHLINEGECNLATLAMATLGMVGSRCRVQPVSGYRGSVGIHHPSSVRLLSDAEPHLPRWEDALNRCLDEIRSEVR